MKFHPFLVMSLDSSSVINRSSFHELIFIILMSAPLSIKNYAFVFIKLEESNSITRDSTEFSAVNLSCVINMRTLFCC